MSMLNFKDMVATSTGDEQHMLGKFLYFTLASVLVDKESYGESQSRQFVSESFGGSLPAFLAAFTRKRQLSDREIDAMQAMINAYRKENRHD